MGFVLELARALLEVQESGKEEGPQHAAVSAALDMSSTWSEFCIEAGPLQQLLREQTEELCGPRPIRLLTEEGSELADLAGGGLMSGREILALLQGMSAMGVMS